MHVILVFDLEYTRIVFLSIYACEVVSDLEDTRIVFIPSTVDRY